jgi:hypothetical protein
MTNFPWLDREQHLAERERTPDEVCPDCGENPCGCEQVIIERHWDRAQYWPEVDEEK